MGKSVFNIVNGVLLSYTGTGKVCKIPPEVTSIEDKAFSNLPKLEKIVFPNGIECKPEYFENCPLIKFTTPATPTTTATTAKIKIDVDTTSYFMDLKSGWEKKGSKSSTAILIPKKEFNKSGKYENYNKNVYKLYELLSTGKALNRDEETVKECSKLFGDISAEFCTITVDDKSNAGLKVYGYDFTFLIEMVYTLKRTGKADGKRANWNSFDSFRGQFEQYLYSRIVILKNFDDDFLGFSENRMFKDSALSKLCMFARRIRSKKINNVDALNKFRVKNAEFIATAGNKFQEAFNSLTLDIQTMTNDEFEEMLEKFRKLAA